MQRAKTFNRLRERARDLRSVYSCMYRFVDPRAKRDFAYTSPEGDGTIAEGVSNLGSHIGGHERRIEELRLDLKRSKEANDCWKQANREIRARSRAVVAEISRRKSNGTLAD